MVDESQSLTQQTPHNKHHCQTDKLFLLCIHDYHGSFLLTLGSGDKKTITPCGLVKNNGSVLPVKCHS